MPPIKALKIAGNPHGKDHVIDHCDLKKIKKALKDSSEHDRFFISADIFANNGYEDGNENTLALFRYFLKANQLMPGKFNLVRRLFATSVQKTLRAFAFKAVMKNSKSRGAALKALFFEDYDNVSADQLDRLIWSGHKRIINRLNQIEQAIFSGKITEAQFNADLASAKFANPLEKILYQKYGQSLRRETAWVQELTADELQQASRYLDTLPRLFEVSAVFEGERLVKDALTIPAKKGVEFADTYADSLTESDSDCSSQTTQESSDDGTLSDGDGPIEKNVRGSHDNKALSAAFSSEEHSMSQQIGSGPPCTVRLCFDSALSGKTGLSSQTVDQQWSEVRRARQAPQTLKESIAEFSTAREIDLAILAEVEKNIQSLHSAKPTLYQRKKEYNKILADIANNLTLSQRLALVLYLSKHASPINQKTPHLLAQERHMALNAFCCFYKRDISSIETRSMHTAIRTLLTDKHLKELNFQKMWYGKTLYIKDKNKNVIAELERHADMFRRKC